MLAECDTVFAVIQLEYPPFVALPPFPRIAPAVIFVAFAHNTFRHTRMDADEKRYCVCVCVYGWCVQ